MILTFSELKFEKYLLENRKGTTFREDKHNRWDIGMTANLWMHNPRNVKLKPHFIKDDIIYDIDCVQLIPILDTIKFYFDLNHKEWYQTISIKNRKKRLNNIAFVDGFENWEEMKQWFLKRGYTDPHGYAMKRLCFKSFYVSENLPF